MTELLVLVASAALIENFVLVRFLGLCPLLGASSQFSNALGLAGATAFVLVLSTLLNAAAERLLIAPFGAEILRTPVYILLIAAAVQFLELYLRSTQPLLHRVLGVYLPLITTNCAVLGVTLISQRAGDSLLEALLRSIGAAAGFGLVLILFANLRARLSPAVPKSWQGAPVALVIAALMGLGFMGLQGIGT
jgi:Na+-translocating ferredoxin:NAD+ oxidoreductase subunit A